MLIPNAEVRLRNPVTGYNQSATTDGAGMFRFNNVPANMYELLITAPGFESGKEQVEVRNSVPINLSFTLQMAAVSTSVDCQCERGSDRYGPIGAY